MDAGSQWIWVSVFAIGVSLVIGIRVYSARARRLAFAEFGQRFGFHIEKTAFSRAEKKLIPLFRRGVSPKFKNSVASAEGVKVFDFQYTFGLPMVASTTYYQTVVAFPVCGINLPDFQLAPATVIDKSAMRFGIGVKISGNPDFSRRYLLRGSDADRLTAIFTQLAPSIENMDPEGKLWVEKGGHWLIVYSHNVMAASNGIEHFVGWAHSVAAIFGYRDRVY